MARVQLIKRKRRDGTLYQTWSLRCFYTPPSGKRRETVKATSYKQKRNAQAEAAELEVRLELFEAGRGANPLAEVSADRTIAELVEDFLGALAAGAFTTRRRGGRRGKPKPEYVARSRGRLTRLLQWLRVETLAGIHSLGDGATVEIERIAGEQAWSDKTRDDHVRIGRQFFEWLTTSGRMTHNPFAKVRTMAGESSKTFERRALTVDELSRLADAAEERAAAEWARTHQGASEERLQELRAQGRERGTLYLFAAFTGFRRGEDRATTWGDLRLDGDNPAATIRATNAKNGRAETVPLPRFLADRLLSLKHERIRDLGRVVSMHEPLFQVVGRHLLDHLRLDAAFAGLGEVRVTSRRTAGGNRVRTIEWVDPVGPHVRLTFHGFRTTYATFLAESGVDIKTAIELFRVSDPKVLLGIYAKVRSGAKRRAVDSLPVPEGVTQPVTHHVTQPDAPRGASPRTPVQDGLANPGREAVG